jgi:hypothetical protein
LCKSKEERHTIGHGNQGLDELVDRLKAYNVLSLSLSTEEV